ncbi:MAG: hypothetical protein WCK39_03495 [Methanomassiliicoccales archaeon]
MDREELMKIKAEMSRRDYLMGRAMMKLGAIVAVVSFGLIAIIVLVNGPLKDLLGSIVGWVLALALGFGILFILYGALKYSSSKD